MKISKLIAKLAEQMGKHGDIEVMIYAEAAESPFEACTVFMIEVDEDDVFPDDWNMPTGFKYISIES